MECAVQFFDVVTDLRRDLMYKLKMGMWIANQALLDRESELSKKLPWAWA